MKSIPILFLAAYVVARAAAADTAAQLAGLEHQLGGRIGVEAISTGTGHRLEYRSQEAFPLCSTFKFLLAAAILQQSEQSHQPLTRSIAYTRADLVGHSPVTAAHVKEGSLTVGELAAAAVAVSDNGAANLLLKEVGGPAGVTRYVRTLGDSVTRLDRNEPSLNSAEPGDPRDTTTPAAYAQDMNTLILGSALSSTARKTLTGWIQATTTGAARIHAGLPFGWKEGDKTGTGEHGAVNDCAVIWPLGRPPIILCVFFVGSSRSLAEREAVFGRIARMVTDQAF